MQISEHQFKQRSKLKYIYSITLQVFFDLMRAIAARKAQENQGDGSERKKKTNCCILL